jgi:hypothetical protein
MQLYNLIKQLNEMRILQDHLKAESSYFKQYLNFIEFVVYNQVLVKKKLN